MCAPTAPSRSLPVYEDNGDYCMRATGTSGEGIYWSHAGAMDERWPEPAT